MKKSVLCLLVDGFEEIETVTPVDVLRRAGVEVTIAALADKTATGKQGMRLEADALLDDVDASDFDLLLIPGGPGVAALRSDGRPAKLAAQFATKHKPVAAICAAPLVLMDAGLLAGKKFTAYHSVREELGGGLDDRVVVDGQVITSRGAGTALDFSLAIVKHLLGAKAALDVAEEIMA
jgi:4-methyl-5(b-hydroxyethyl)-thiazole monophosphate biosynthesis